MSMAETERNTPQRKVAGPRIQSRRGGVGMHPRSPAIATKSRAIRSRLPEYLDKADVEALMRAAPDPAARLLMLVQWRAGLRVTEAINLRWDDLDLVGDHPTLHVRAEVAKGGVARRVPLHPELHSALTTTGAYVPRAGFYRHIFGNNARVGDPIDRSTAWRKVKDAQRRAEGAGALTPGRKIGTHTLRHSFARHALAHGTPINELSRWLGHRSIQTTLIYLEILPDPYGHIERLP